MCLCPAIRSSSPRIPPSIPSLHRYCSFILSAFGETSSTYIFTTAFLKLLCFNTTFLGLIRNPPALPDGTASHFVISSNVFLQIEDRPVIGSGPLRGNALMVCDFLTAGCFQLSFSSHPFFKVFTEITGVSSHTVSPEAQLQSKPFYTFSLACSLLISFFIFLFSSCRFRWLVSFLVPISCVNN